MKVRIMRHYILLLYTIFNNHEIFAQAGKLDTSFNYHNAFIPSVPGTSNQIYAFIEQPDGKMLIGGNLESYNSYNQYKSLIRIHSDGYIDTTFDVGINGYKIVRNLALQSDGKLLVVYDGTTSSSNNILVRLHSNGKTDTSFITGTGTSKDGKIHTVAQLPDGKILIGGSFSSYNSTNVYGLLRLNSNGSIDTTFVNGIPTGGGVRNILIQNNGQLIITGGFRVYDNHTTSLVARVYDNGKVDTTFTSSIDTNSFIISSTTDSSGKIIVAGTFIINGKELNCALRLNQNGSIDNSLTVDTGANSYIQSVSIQSDGKILISGAFTEYERRKNVGLARLNYNGTVDTSFITNDGVGKDSFLRIISNTTKNKIMIAGGYYYYYYQDYAYVRRQIAKLNYDGSPDYSFNKPGGVNGRVNSMLADSNGKLILAGSINWYNGTRCNDIIRINPNGEIDSTFLPGFWAWGEKYALLKQPDGKILVGGGHLSLLRINKDGSKDTSFNTIRGEGSIRTIALQPDGKIIVGGYFFSYNGFVSKSIVRLNTDGTVDTSFMSGLSEPRSIYCISLQSDGKILIGGGNIIGYDNNFTRYDLIRVFENGRLDTSFRFYGWGSIYKFKELSDGKIIVAGRFLRQFGVSPGNITRILSNGNYDTTFNVGIGILETDVKDFAIQNDGKIIIGADYNTVNEVSSNNLTRLFADGSIDLTFNSGTGTGIYPPESILMLNDSRIIIGGNFGEYDNVMRDGIASIVTDQCHTMPPTAVSQLHCTKSTISDLVATGNNLKWYLPGNIISIDSNTLLRTGNYYVSQFLNGCESSKTIIRVDVVPDTRVTVEYRTLKALSGRAKYQWVDCNNNYLPLPNDTLQTYKPTRSGSFAVILNDNGCIDTSVCNFIIPVGNEEIAYNFINIFPNPAENKINVLLNHFADIEIYSLQGKLIQIHSNHDSYEIDITDFKPGLYIIKCEGHAYKFIVK